MSRTLIVNRRTAAAAIADRATFRNSGGTLRGAAATLADTFSGMGRLATEHRDALCAALKSGAADYIVWSYGTPIAWTGSAGDVIPAERYSPTTSGHQTIARVALSLSPADPYIAHSRSLQH